MIQNELCGFLLINKPVDISSYDCIRHIKRLLPKKTKIGHAGTLDNFATGLLVIGIGRQATKMLSTLTNASKEYVATAKLGELTDTLDRTGQIITSQEVALLNPTTLTKTIANFPREYTQTPPAYSALKFQGKPLYELARHKKISDAAMDEILKNKTRTITIHALELTDYNHPFFTVKAHVSKGTYIRSLMNDIAQALKLNASTYELCRTQVGELSLSNAINLLELKTIDDVMRQLKSVELAGQADL